MIASTRDGSHSGTSDGIRLKTTHAASELVSLDSIQVRYINVSENKHPLEIDGYSRKITANRNNRG